MALWGAGVALAFKHAYPAMFDAYRRACSAGEVRPGVLNVWHTPSEWIINLPTKRHWRDRSRYEDIASGLNSLRVYLDGISHPVRVALPALGCNNGGLEWNRVARMIVERLSSSRAHVLAFAPGHRRTPS